jgi:hypothetical protein
MTRPISVRALFSPIVLVASALLLLLAFAAVHLAGWRESTTVLSGTLPPGASGWAEPTRQALLYIAAYLGCTVLAPILALAGLIQWLLERVALRKYSGDA